jgi:hypothetical protein
MTPFEELRLIHLKSAQLGRSKFSAKFDIFDIFIVSDHVFGVIAPF